MPALIVAAVLVACSVALLAFSEKRVEAAFPGKNSRIAFAANDQIFTVNPDGTGEKRLTSTSSPLGYNTTPSYSSDGTKIAWERNGNIWVMDSDGTNKQRLTNTPAEDYDPAFSPGGRGVVFVRYDPEVRPDRTDIYIKALGGSLRRVTNDPDSEAEPVFSPGGDRIAFTRHKATPCRPDDCAYAELASVRSDGTGLRAITDIPGKAEALGPDWSPDGRRLVFRLEKYDKEGNSLRKPRLQTVRADGTGRRTVFAQPTHSVPYRPVYSPNGTKIAVGYGGDISILRINADDTEPISVIGSRERWEFALDWGPKPTG
jgi:Tol biopolymer transport system component